LGSKKPDKGINEKKYLSALVSHNTKLTDALTKNQEIVDFLVGAVAHDINFTNYFAILQYANESGEFLSNVEKPVDFFVALIDKIQNYCVQDFLIALCSKKSSNNLEWLLKANADRILMERMYSEEKTVFACLLLLYYILKNQENDKLSKRISVYENYRIVFDTGIDAPTVEIGDLSFKILIQMINTADGTHEDDRKSAFDLIVDALVADCEKLCVFIVRDNEFLCDKYNAVELIIAVVKNQSSAEKCVFDTARFLFKHFFEQPTNTFAQLAFVELFSCLLEQENGCREFIEENRIHERLIFEHNNMNGITKIYHGFIIKIANELASFISSNQIEAPEDWDDFVKSVVSPTLKTYKTNYGGRVPVTLMDTIGAKANFIEDDDDSKDDGFEDVSSSSSSSSSGEYEEEKSEDSESK
jgi:hypothetical protein